MANEINKEEQENKVIQRTASVLVKEKKTDVTGRTCPVYVVREDVLALNDIVNEKPIDYTKEIHISWIDKALNQFAKEQKYTAWDLIPAPQGAWVSSAYGNKCGIVAGADSQVIITLDNGNTWETVSVIADLSCIAFGSKVNEDDTVTNRFIALSSTGQGIYSDDNGKTWQGLTIPNDNYTGIAFIKGKFIAISSNGKIYVSYDMTNFNELNIDVAGFQFTAIATDGDKRVMIVGSSGTNRALYSNDVANKFKETNLAQNTWTSVAYGEGKFIAVSTDGDNNIAVFDVVNVKGVWSYTQAPTQEEWRSISYGARVFTAVSTSGKVISSLQGNRWHSVPGHTGEWNTILRTDFFFIALSIADNEQGYNAMRSSNAGLTLIDFATLQEIIEQEPTLKAISPQVLIDYLHYRFPWKLVEGGTERTDGFSQGLATDVGTAGATLKYTAEETTADEQAEAVLSIKDGNIYHTATGKEKGNVAVFDEDKYIKAIVDGINIQVIDDNSPITSYDEIIETGFYGVAKDLQNKPLFTEEDDNVGHMILQVISLEIQGQKIIFQNIFLHGNTLLAYPNYYYRYGQIVDGVAQFSIWQKKVINHKEIDFTDFIAEKSKYNIIQLTEETDLNNINATGKYLFLGSEEYSNSITNKPTELNELAFILEVDSMPYYDGNILKNQITQRTYDILEYDFNITNKIKYFRLQLNSETNTWSNWQKKDIDLSTVASVSESTTTMNKILVKDDNGIIKDITLSDFINNHELFTKELSNSAVNSLVVTDKAGITHKINKTDFIAENAKLAVKATNSINAELADLSKDIKYNFILENSPVISVKELPYGYNIITKILDDEPLGLRRLGTSPLIYKYKRIEPIPDSIRHLDVYIAYLTNFALFENINIYAIAFANKETELLEWKYDFKTLDLSVSTEVSEIGTFSASQTILMEENGAIKKVDKSKLITALKQELSDITLPVGFIYIQLRGQSTPDQLFGSSGKWQDISSTYAGEFFRAAGGASASFGSKQNEGLPNIQGSTEYAKDFGLLYGGAEAVPTTTGAFYKGARTNGTFQPGQGGSNYFLSFQASRSNSIYGSSTHVTPYNSAIRIWKKIS